MYGLMAIGALVIYAVVSLAVVMYATVNGGKLGGPGWLWGLVAALVMYNLVFWDYLPTVIAHKYYCEKEAGFWVYKTLDQWKAENPGVMETLTTQKVWQHNYAGGKDVVHINQRFDLEYIDGVESFINRWRWERLLRDRKNNEVLARYVDFSSGNGHIGGELELRFWLHSDYCAGGGDRAIKFGAVTTQFKGMEK